MSLAGPKNAASAYLITEAGAKEALAASVPIPDIEVLFKDGGAICSHSLAPPPVTVHESRRASVCATFVSNPTVTVLSEDPLILVVDDALPPERVSDLKRSFEELERANAGTKTNTYVDDIFDSDNRAADDAHFARCVGASAEQVPDDYAHDPLRAFLWLAATNRDALPPADVAAALFMVQKRAFQAKWESEPRGRELLADSGFQRAATRWRMPEHMIRLIAPLVVNVFGCGAKRVPGNEEISLPDGSDVSWELHDATVVEYRHGQSQVPHMDTADVTLLTYLSDHGGCTCFPNLRKKVRPRAGRLLLFFSTRPETRSVLGTDDLPVWDTLHYWELPEGEQRGEKLVVQVLLSARDLGSAHTWVDTLRGRFFSKGLPRLADWPSYLEGHASRTRPVRSIALSTETCAQCNDKALDMEPWPGSPKYCLSCWSSSLERDLKERAIV